MKKLFLASLLACIVMLSYGQKTSFINLTETFQADTLDASDTVFLAYPVSAADASVAFQIKYTKLTGTAGFTGLIGWANEADTSWFVPYTTDTLDTDGQTILYKTTLFEPGYLMFKAISDATAQTGIFDGSIVTKKNK